MRWAASRNRMGLATLTMAVRRFRLTDSQVTMAWHMHAPSRRSFIFSVAAGALSTVASCASQRASQESPSAADAAFDDATDTGMTGCTESLRAYCSGDASGLDVELCGPTLSAALAAACSSAWKPYLAKGCAGFDVLTFTGIDSSWAAYFDSVTGNPIAVVDRTANFGGTEQCVAGPPSFVAPVCPLGSTALGCPEAGAPDGGAGCKYTSDCPPTPGAACASACADGTNPCLNACIGGACVERGCPDGGVGDAPADAAGG